MQGSFVVYILAGLLGILVGGVLGIGSIFLFNWIIDKIEWIFKVGKYRHWR